MPYTVKSNSDVLIEKSQLAHVTSTFLPESGVLSYACKRVLYFHKI